MIFLHFKSVNKQYDFHINFNWILLRCQNFDIQLYKISYNSKKRTRVWYDHISFKISQLIVFAERMWHNLHSLADVYENVNTNSVAIVHELRYIIGMNIEKLAVKLRVNLDASRRPRCLRAETCCGQLSSPFLPPPYSPIAATSPLQNCTNILDYPAPWRCLVPSVAVELPLPIRTRRGKLLGKEGVTTGVDIQYERKNSARTRGRVEKGEIFFERHVVNLS